MPDPRFYLTFDPLAPSRAAKIAGARLVRKGTEQIRRAASAVEPDLSDAVVYADGVKRLGALAGRRLGLCIAPDDLADKADVDGAVAGCAEPRLAFARIAAALHAPREDDPAAGVHSSAEIDATARVHPTAVVGSGARIGARASIGPHVHIGTGVVIGEDARIAACVSIVCSLIGARVNILAGARIGERGFGFAPTPAGFVEIPQLGRVLIGDDVEIGANTTIDRGALEDTVIGDGVKIDNLVQIGHNVRIGANSALAALVGIAGSTVLGRNVMVGGQTGMADHIEVGDGVRIAPQSGLMRNVPANEHWGGSPARPARVWFREIAALARLAAPRKRGPR